MKIFDYIVQSGLLVALLGLAVSAITYGKKWIDARAQEITSKIQDTTIRHAVDTVENAATTVVYKLAQTTVDDLKEKAADGKLTADEIDQLRTDSLAQVKQLVGTDVLNTIQTFFGDAEAWITAKIEAAVKSMKLNSLVSIAEDAGNYPEDGLPTADDNAAQDSAPADQPAAQDATTPAPQATAPDAAQTAEAEKVRAEFQGIDNVTMDQIDQLIEATKTAVSKATDSAESEKLNLSLSCLETLRAAKAAVTGESTPTAPDAAPVCASPQQTA